MRKKSIIFGMLLLLWMNVLLGGCAGKQDSAGNDTAKEEKEETLKNIGTEAEGENIYKVVLENETGKNIVGFSVKDSSMTEFPASMLGEDDIFETGERRNLYYDSTSAVEAAGTQTAEAGEEANVLTPQFDIQLTFDDQTSMVLTAFPFGDVEEASVCLEDEVAFIEYESVASKETVSTKEAELAVKAEAAAAAQAQAEAEAAAAAQAQAEAEAAAAAQAQAEAEAAAAAQAQAEAEAAAQAQAAARQQQQQQAPASSGDGCMNGGLVY